MSEFLKDLSKVVHHKKKRNKLISKATKRELNSLRNICFNICRKRFDLKKKDYIRICKYKTEIRDLGNLKKLKNKTALRKRLCMRGGWLPIVIPAILSILSSIGGKLVNRIIGI